MKLLFIARTYPPLIGGMEKFAKDFYTNIGMYCETTLIANRVGKKVLIPFFIKTIFYLLFNNNKFDIIHFNDGVLSPLALIIKSISKAKITMTVHGLDIVYKKYGYQWIVIPFLKYFDRIFPVSKFTYDQCRARNIPANKLEIIPNALDFASIASCSDEGIRALLSKIEIDILDKQILLTLGRLIPRKGHQWFIENVFVNLPDNYTYLIAGDGPEFDQIKDVINHLMLGDRIDLLGYISDNEKACLYEMSDLFIMPNIRVIGDQEGFGIVLLEAGSYGVPCIAADIEGISDAVIENVSGVLVKEKDDQEFFNAIINSSFNRDEIIQTIQAKYNWKKISKTYYTEFVKLLQD